MPTVVTTITSNRFAEIAARLPQEVGQVVGDTCKNIETRVKDGMASAKSGRLYSRGTRDHQASAPGEMPAIDESHLLNSIRAEMTAETEGAVYTDDVPYAIVLEYGTVHMAARPFFTPAAEAERGPFVTEMSRLERHLG